MDMQDQILSAVLDIQADVKDVKNRLGKVEVIASAEIKDGPTVFALAYIDKNPFFA